MKKFQWIYTCYDKSHKSVDSIIVYTANDDEKQALKDDKIVNSRNTYKNLSKHYDTPFYFILEKCQNAKRIPVYSESV